jgi:hypothetical protein
MLALDAERFQALSIQRRIIRRRIVKIFEEKLWLRDADSPAASDGFRGCGQPLFG